jgi:hypothetical protein
MAKDTDLMAAPSADELDDLMAAPSAEELSGMPSDISKTESFARGAGQGISFGLADEITGAINQPMGALAQMANLIGADINNPNVEAYKKERDESRAAYDAADLANPGTSLAGNVTGGIAQALATAPLAGLNLLKGAVGGAKALSGSQKVLQAAKLGAGMGAANALGTSEEESFKPLAKDIAAGTVLGGAGGAVLSGAGQVLGKGAGKVADIAEDYGIGKKFLRSFQVGREGTDLLSNKVRDVAETSTKTGAESVRTTLNDMVSKVGAIKSKVLDAAEKADVRINLTDDLNMVRQKLDQFGTGPLARSDRNVITDILTSFEKRHGLSDLAEMSPKVAQTLKSEISDYTTFGDQSLKTKEGTNLLNELAANINEKIRTKVSDPIVNSIDDPFLKSLLKANPQDTALGSIDNAYSSLKSGQEIIRQSGTRGVSDVSDEVETLRKLMSNVDADTSGGTASRLKLKQVADLMGKINPELESTTEGILNKAKTSTELLDLVKAAKGTGSGNTIGRTATQGLTIGANVTGRLLGGTESIIKQPLTSASNLIQNTAKMLDKSKMVHGADSFITKALEKITNTVDENKKKAMVNTLMQQPYYRQKMKALEEMGDDAYDSVTGSDE